ncbi:MAG: adenylate/guanylate cyclase domain-containing protein [Thermodesulfovibrionales bacterium]
MKKKKFFYLITLISTMIFVLLQWYDPDAIREHIESRTYDFRLRLRDSIRKPLVSDDIVVVSIDEKSIRQIGRWPWRREVMAELINRISGARPKVIGVDIMFTEPDNAASDLKLAEAISHAGNVVLAMPFFVPEGKQYKGPVAESPGYLWEQAFMEVRSPKGIPWANWVITAESVTLPVENIARAATLGYVYTRNDLDAVTRWEIMYLKYGDDYYPPLSLQVARLALGIASKDVVVYGGAGLQFGPQFIPTDLSGRVLINYAGREHTYHYVSALDIIKDPQTAVRLRNKIVLVGTSALATYDQKITPLSTDTPGVEKNANVVSNIINNDFIRPSPGIVEMVVIIVTGIFLGLLLPKLGALPSSLVAAGFILLYLITGVSLLIYANLWVNLLYPTLNMICIAVVQTGMRFFHEERQAKEIRRIFSSYVSPKIVKELIDHPEKAKLGGERKVATILFSDVIGFTSLSEKREPEDVVALLNEYFEEMTEIIFKWEGTLDKFVGDEIMVLWGAPLDQPDHAERAVQCALDMSRKLDEMRRDWARRGVEGLDCGIGINTGEVVIGNIGAFGKKMDYTAIGDHVNLAARVEKLTRQYGTRILVTENTYLAMKQVTAKSDAGNQDAADQDTGQDGEGPVFFSELGAVRVKGKEQEVRIYGCRREQKQAPQL